jgi:hypothetical protein
MAAPDTLSRIRSEIDARLRELRPAVEEYARLRLGAGALATSAASPSARRARRTAAPAKPTRRLTAAKASRTPELRGPSQRVVVAVLREHATPDSPMTARQLADATGLAPTAVHGVLTPLAKRGVIEQSKKPGRKAYALPIAS